MKKKNQPATSLLACETKMGKDSKTLEGLAEISFPAHSSSSRRTSLNLAIALDASGSMARNSNGASALDHAKAATMALLERLDDNDRISIVAYSGAPVVILQSTPVAAARRMIKQALAGVHPMGSTALHAGWLAAAQQAAPFVEKYNITRILLLSDGQATDGMRDEKLLTGEAEKLLGAGMSTSTYGLGMYFNEQLMTGMATGGGGVARYAENADTLIPYFESDFSMLAQTVAKSVHLHLSAKNPETGEDLEVELMGGGSVEGERWRLAPGVAGASSWAAFSVKVASHPQVQLQARWEIVDLDGNTSTHEEAKTMERGRGRKNKAVIARVSEVKAAAAADAAAQAARLGDRISTRAHLDVLHNLAQTSAYASAVSNHLNTLEASGNLGALVKETAYVGATMRSRVVDANEQHDRLSKDRFGLRKAVQGKTQNNTEADNK